jgi:hypothetical protein
MGPSLWYVPGWMSTPTTKTPSPVRRLRAWLLEPVAAPREIRSARTRGNVVAELLPKGGVGAELGVFKRRFSPVLLRTTEAERLHLVDPWYLLRYLVQS